ncbi:MAG: TSUP family transporter [Deltaproteobacteria bacterium]|nr:TSUP family transporter [Deltaproteobacteria bacterium]
MTYLIIALAAMSASALTLFSGFGLGTLLLPVFALFVPVEMAVAATAIVHGANNVLKIVLLGKYADWKIVFRFGLPAMVAAFIGAAFLGMFAALPPLLEYSLLGKAEQITPVKLLLGILILGFAFFELLPRFQHLKFKPRYLPLGGLLSGFFGGLSGHQGALRSAFLAKTDMTAPAFVGTNAVIGLLVDASRLLVYGAVLFSAKTHFIAGKQEVLLILTGIVAAFSGVVLGKRYLHKMTMRVIQYITGVLLLLIGTLLSLGLV